MTVSQMDARNDPRNANIPLVNQPQSILGVTITFLTLAVLAASLRLWSRFRDRLWGWDDAFVLLAGIASISGDILVCQMPYDGLGLHFYTLSQSNKQAYFKHVWSTNVAYCASTTLIKLAILFQYMRFFAETTTSLNSPDYRLARRCIWSVIVVSAVWGLLFFLLALFPCEPIAKNWDSTLKGKCIGWGTKVPSQFFAMWVSHAATNMSIDVIVLMLPLPFLRILRIAGKSKIGLVTLFAMGTIVAAVSMGRMIALCINRAGTQPIQDMSYYTPVVYIFSVLEVNIAILCASIPIFWPIISSFATNNILVVNEIVVRVEEFPKNSLDGQPGIGLAEQGAWKSPPDSPDVPAQQSSRLNKIAKTFDQWPSKRSNESLKTKHKNNGSIASSISKPGQNQPVSISSRSSQDSKRNLYKTMSHETGILTKSDYDWFAELDRECVGKRTTTTIEKGDNPFDTRRPSKT